MQCSKVIGAKRWSWGWTWFIVGTLVVCGSGHRCQVGVRNKGRLRGALHGLPVHAGLGQRSAAKIWGCLQIGNPIHYLLLLFMLLPYYITIFCATD